MNTTNNDGDDDEDDEGDYDDEDDWQASLNLWGPGYFFPGVIAPEAKKPDLTVVKPEW